jgi:hypothetical protein
MTAQTPPETVRVGRFEWERLMLMSPLPRATKTILLVLGVFMSEDGGDARPGLENFVTASGRGRSSLIEHLAIATAAGYLDVVERGGFRRKTARASEYAASVPKQVWADRDGILRAPPWRRNREEGPTSEKPDVRQVDEGPKNRTLVNHEGPNFRDEGPSFPSRTSEKPDPTTQFHHASNTTSPLPPTDGGLPDRSGTGEGGKGDFSPEEEQRIKTLTDAMHRRRPTDLRWKPAKVRAAILTCLADGKTLDEVEHAFPPCEADPGTNSPGRLPLPFPWWPTPSQPDAPEAAPLDNSPCPHPYHRDVARNCSPCWADVKAGQDPFAGYEHLRPDGWDAIYRKKRQAASPPTPGSPGWIDWVAASSETRAAAITNDEDGDSHA